MAAGGAISTQHLLIHERLGVWARQLRPRLAALELRFVETRTPADVAAALEGVAGPFPLALIDLGRDPAAGLGALDRLLQVAPQALALVLSPAGGDNITALAFELGALDVLAGPVAPPEVADRLARWFPLARRRAASAGWSPLAPVSAEAQPDDWVAALLRP